MSDIRPNKLHDLASYSVQYDLYMMHPEDFNHIQDSLLSSRDGSIETLAYQFISNTPERLLMSSKGNQTVDVMRTFTDFDQGNVSILSTQTNRYFQGKNYHINNVNISSYISPSKKTGGAKYTNASFTISEPYGATLIENLIKATVMLGQKNYHEMPYMLKVSFKGWDGDGKPQSHRLGKFTTKWLMLKIGNINFKVDPDGTEYNIEMYNYSDSAFGHRIGSLPFDIQVNSDTVMDFFNFDLVGAEGTKDSSGGGGVVETESQTVGTDDYSGQAFADGDPRKTTKRVTTAKDKTYKSITDILNKKQLYKVNEVQDTYAFALDSGSDEEALKRFQEAKILKADSLDANNIPVYSNKIDAAGITQAGLSAEPNVAGSISLQLPKGMGIETLIKTVISSSSFMTDQVTTIPGVSSEGWHDPDTYKLEESEEKPLYLYKITPIVKILEWDDTRKAYGRHVTYVISLFKSNGRAEKATPTYGLTDVVKSYDYLYTGQNKDVLEFDMEFNSAALDLNIVGGYRQGLEGGVIDKDAPPDEQIDQSIEKEKNHIQHVDPFSTPYVQTRNQTGIWQSGSESDYRTVMSKNFMSRIYQGGADKLTGTLTIVGDPDFICQQEGFGLSAHSSLYVNNSVNTHRDPIVRIRFLTPPDINTDTGLLETHSGVSTIQSKGVSISLPTGNTISVFSGYYRVLQITSEIVDNVFKQILQLIRVEVQDEVDDKDKESTVGKDIEDAETPHKEDKKRKVTYDTRVTTRMFRTSHLDGYKRERVYSKYISAERSNVRGAPEHLTSGAGTGHQIKEGLTTIHKATFIDGTTTKRHIRPGGTGTQVTVNPDGSRDIKTVTMKGPQSWAYDPPKKDGPS